MRQFLNLRREGYDGMDPLEADVLRLYFGESTRLREATMTFSKKSKISFGGCVCKFAVLLHAQTMGRVRHSRGGSVNKKTSRHSVVN